MHSQDSHHGKARAFDKLLPADTPRLSLFLCKRHFGEKMQATAVTHGPVVEITGPTLHLPPGQFFWFFLITIAGIMGGAWMSGRLAGRIKPQHQIRHGFLIMLLISIVNLALNLLFTPHAWWALLPLGIYAFGWALMVPVVTLMVLDLNPERRGMASSFQACIGSLANGLVAGVIAPLVMHSTIGLAAASLLMMSIGVLAWIWVKPHVTGGVPHPVST